ncbi:MAG: hypothetical protein IH944_01440 [Armatimonadetes bacterium]|nr:hypothetical protein [Armatimonadota bacterium]
MRRWCTALLLVLLSAVAIGQLPTAPNDHTKDYEKLIGDAKAIPRLGTGSNVIIAGPDAFALVTANSVGNTAAIVGASRYGLGLAVVFGNTPYLGRQGLNDKTIAGLIDRIIRFGLKQQREPRIAVYNSPGLLASLTDAGYLAKEFKGVDWTKDLKFYDAVLTSNIVVGNGRDINALREYIRTGGTFLAAGNGWQWQRQNPTRLLWANNHINAVLNQAGLVLGQKPVYAIRNIVPADVANTHSQMALKRLVEHRDRKVKLNDQQLRQYSGILMDALKDVSPYDVFVRRQLENVLEYVNTRIVPTEAKPLLVSKPLERLSLYQNFLNDSSLSAAEVTSHAAAREFPGTVPRRAPRVNRAVLMDSGIPGWSSTGLYANAGDRITITLAASLVKKGIKLRIGAHTDQLWLLNSWKRHPVVSREYALDKTDVEVRSAFGGLIYVVVPGARGLPAFSVEIDGAVPAPFFKIGTTSKEEWITTIRDLPAPWAELEANNIVLTVPSEVVRELDDPQDLLNFWDSVMAKYAELSTRPLPTRKQRMVCDVQISAGYMHSGYPIMMWMDQPENLVSIHLSDKGPRDNWGFWHELGHNFQHPDWTFVGTTEVTCNLYSMYVLDTVFGTDPMTAAQYDVAKLREFLDAGASFNQWKREPFLALMLYAQLQSEFGWDAFKKVFEVYRRLPNTERPKNDAQKRDQWMVRFSRAVGRNLGPFFMAWGIPVTDSARRSISGLPIWMPEDLGSMN